MPLPRRLIALGIALFVAFALARPALTLLVDYQWFDSLGFDSVWKTTFGVRAGLWLGGAAVALFFFELNLRAAWSGMEELPLAGRVALGDLRLAPRRVLGLVRRALTIGILLASVMLGAIASGNGLDVLLVQHRRPFGVVDPQYGLDVGFYVYLLPLLLSARAWASGLVIVSLAMSAVVHFVREAMQGPGIQGISRRGGIQLCLLGAGFFVLLAVGYWLDRYGLLFHQRGVVFGAGHADVHAQIPALVGMAAASLVAAGALVWTAIRPGWKLPLFVVASFVATAFVVNGMVPSMVQSYVVKPNELQLEAPFLARSIEATRAAWGIENVEVRPFEGETALTLRDVSLNPGTVDNVRLWDPGPLLTTYKQLQEIRLYYDFRDVDIDRYLFEGSLRQVMVSARELNYQNVPAAARSWVNEHFQYTHGHGAVMSPVNVVTAEGLPDLWVRDIPPVAPPGLEVTRPEIYFGELTDRYVFVGTAAEEFDYATGEKNVYTRWEGAGGVPVASFSQKLLYSTYFGSMDILLANYLVPGSRVLFRRSVSERVARVAPFLVLDADPYLVVAEGRLVWVIDAYTTTASYPYSAPFEFGGRRRANYARNSVKVTVDAYEGTVEFYVADPADPLVQSWSDAFPGMFRPIDDMPASLRPHLRYPKDLFDAQAEMFRAWHMTDPNVFYNREDMWERPREMIGGSEQPMASYYLITRLPEEAETEMLLLLPFVPTNRDNMNAWLAARCDPPHQGELVLYQFPKQTLVYGPRQVEARIDQSPEISQMITLWGQAGSRVVRGTLQVIPIEKSLLYVQALYLQAETGQLPELKRVIVSHANRIAMRETFGEALHAVIAGGGVAAGTDAAGGEATAKPPEGASARTPPEAAAGDWKELSVTAAAALRKAQEAQRAGDWAAYGAALRELEAAVRGLEERAGGTAAPAATAGNEPPPP